MVFQVHPGDILADKYRVDRVLGIGGMGMVVAATHLELHQPVALKFMLGGLAGSPTLLDRFLREARAVARLRSEHVCRIFDVGRLDDGAPYIVMELLNGEDLATVLAREGAQPPNVIVPCLLQAMEGVAEAHAEGIVHRDLKPGNLFITTDRDGTPLVKVLDFGISKSTSAPATKTGDILGSPGYMAPEQMSNAKATDARTDVWALGVILYQALSAAMPWTGESLPALCMSVISDPPPPLPDSVPAALRAIVLRCLEKEPDHRWRDVGELATALAPFGDAGAAQSAARIRKIVSTCNTVARPAQHDESGVVATAATVAPTPTPIRPVSTYSSSAAELVLPPPARSKKAVVIAGVGIAVVGGVIAFVALRGGDGEEREVAAVPAPAPAPAPPPAKLSSEAPVAREPPLEIGRRAFARRGCDGCHSSDGTPRVGPSFAGAWGTTVTLVGGARVVYDEDYFRESILRPSAKVRVGFTDTQPTFELGEEELAGLVAYARSLANVRVQADCTLPGTLDTSGKQAVEYRCGKIDFTTKACRCPDGAFAMRTPSNVAICHEPPAGCAAPVAPVAPVATGRPVRPTLPATTPAPTPAPQQPSTRPPAREPTPEELWTEMTHDKDEKGKDRKR